MTAGGFLSGTRHGINAGELAALKQAIDENREDGYGVAWVPDDDLAAPQRPPRTDYPQPPQSVIAARTPDPEHPAEERIDGEWQWATRDDEGEIWDWGSESIARADASSYPGTTLLRRRIGDWEHVPVGEVAP
jgi:hypothetical protein